MYIIRTDTSDPIIHSFTPHNLKISVFTIALLSEKPPRMPSRRLTWSKYNWCRDQSGHDQVLHVYQRSRWDIRVLTVRNPGKNPHCLINGSFGSRWWLMITTFKGISFKFLICWILRKVQAPPPDREAVSTSHHLPPEERLPQKLLHRETLSLPTATIWNQCACSFNPINF